MRGIAALLGGVITATAVAAALPSSRINLAPPPPAGGTGEEAGFESRPEPRMVEVSRAVQRGLDWLARHQEPCGGWPGDAGHKQEDGYRVYQTAEETRAAGGAHAGVSALAGLAFLADGQLPDRGPYAAVLDRALTYVLSRQNDFGYICDGGSRMYSHSFATLFLSQIHGMFPRRLHEIEHALTAATAFTESCQNEHGAWRYQPFTVEADLSVTVCQVQALRAARDAGIPVSASCIDRVVQYVRDSRIEWGRETGCFYYKIHGRGAHSKTSFTVNAAAVTTLHSAGLYDDALFGPALDFVVDEYPDLTRWYPDHYFFWYGNYYAAQALYAVGGKRWRAYWPRLRDDLLDRQQPDGRWRNSTGPGDDFATAVACLLLRVSAQYLPIFQR